MNDEARSKSDLIAELNDLRQRVRQLEAASAPSLQLRDYLDHIPDLLYIKDRDSRFVRANLAQYRHVGVTAEAAIIGKTDFDFFPQEIAQRYFDNDQRVINSGEALINSEEPYFNVLTGEKGWQLGTRIPVRDEHGSVTGILGITRNITELQRMREVLDYAHTVLEKEVEVRTADLVDANRSLEKEIRERVMVESMLAEERNLLRTLLDIIPDSIYIKDTESRFILANPACANSLGLESTDEIYGRSDFDFFPPEDAERFRADEVQVMQTRVPLVNYEEFGHFLVENEARWTLTTKVPRIDENGTVNGIVGIGRDITERKAVNEALQEYQHFIESVLSSLPGMVHIFDLTLQRYTFVNRALYELLNYTPQNISELGGEVLLKLVHPDDRRHTETSPAHWETVDDGDVRTFEYRLRHHDGSWRWFSARAQVFKRQPDGTVQQIISTAQDITERKQTETALMESEAQYRLLMQQASDGILIGNEAGYYLDANSRICEMLGYTREELLTLKVTDVIVAEDLLRQPIPWQTMREGTVLLERNFRRKDGTTFLSEVSARQLPDGRILAIVRDITERRITEDALRESLQFNEHVISNAGEGIIVYDRHLNYLTWNAKMEELTGLTGGQVVGQPALEFMPELRENGVHQLLIRALKGETVRSHDIYFNIKSTGHSGWMKGTYAPYRSADDHIIGVIAIISDITRQKNAEQQSIDLAMERERVKLLGSFISGISHDLKTPLTVIRTSLYLLKKHTDPEHQLRHMQRLENQIDHLENLLSDILTMSRLDNLRELERDHIDVDSLMHNVHTHMLTLLDEKHIDVRMNLPENLPVLYGNESELNEVLLNLLKNSVTYTPDGGHIFIDVSASDSTLQIIVQDTGIGIKEQDIPRIFDRFYRADKARNTSEGGSGLGLSIVKRIIELHRGSISVSSEAGSGTTFTILLPLDPQTSPA